MDEMNDVIIAGGPETGTPARGMGRTGAVAAFSDAGGGCGGQAPLTSCGTRANGYGRGNGYRRLRSLQELCDSDVLLNI